MAINTQELQGQWTKLRGQVKEKWGQLTDDDLQIHGGNVDQLVGKIQQKTGEGREAVEKFLTELTSKGASAISQAAGAVGNFAQQAGDRFRDQYGNLTDQAREQYEYGQDLVRHNPAQSVAAAFGVGLVAGLIVGLALARSRSLRVVTFLPFSTSSDVTETCHASLGRRFRDHRGDRLDSWVLRRGRDIRQPRLPVRHDLPRPLRGLARLGPEGPGRRHLAPSV